MIVIANKPTINFGMVFKVYRRVGYKIQNVSCQFS